MDDNRRNEARAVKMPKFAAVAYAVFGAACIAFFIWLYQNSGFGLFALFIGGPVGAIMAFGGMFNLLRPDKCLPRGEYEKWRKETDDSYHQDESQFSGSAKENGGAFKKWVTYIAVGAIMCAFLVFGAIFASDFLNRKSVCTARATAEVFEISIRKNSRGASYFPKLKYEADGKEIRVKHNISMGKTAFKVGEKISVLYNPSAPDEFIMDDPRAYYSTLLFSAVFLGIPMVIAAAFIISKIRRNRRPTKNISASA